MACSRTCLRTDLLWLQFRSGERLQTLWYYPGVPATSLFLHVAACSAIGFIFFAPLPWPARTHARNFDVGSFLLALHLQLGKSLFFMVCVGLSLHPMHFPLGCRIGLGLRSVRE